MNKFKVIPVAAVLFLGFLGFSLWYTMMCEADWEGIPLEAGREKQLKEMADSLYADVSYLSETIGPRNPIHYVSLVKTADWIQGRWESQGYTVRRQTFLVEGKECANLEIEITGRRAPSEIIILGAQYDTWTESPGANNNGSGMAVLLKMSEMLMHERPDRTVRLVAFTTQEPPYDNTESMGSLRYARRSRARNEDIRIMLCMDAIGIYKQEPGTQRLPAPFSWFYPDRGNWLAFISDLGSRSCLGDITRGFKKGSSFPIEAGCAPRWVKGVTWSDHFSFWRNGYKAVQITDTGAFRSSTHTTPGDTIEKIDFAALARICFGMYGAVMEVATVRGA